MEIEVVNIDNPSQEILLGKANGNLRHLIPHFDQETQIVLPLVQRDGSFRGEIHLKAIVTEMETALGNERTLLLIQLTHFNVMLLFLYVII